MMCSPLCIACAGACTCYCIRTATATTSCPKCCEPFRRTHGPRMKPTYTIGHAQLGPEALPAAGISCDNASSCLTLPNGPSFQHPERSSCSKTPEPSIQTSDDKLKPECLEAWASLTLLAWLPRRRTWQRPTTSYSVESFELGRWRVGPSL